MPDSRQATAQVGSYVETRRHGHRGRVTAIHEMCPESRGWFRVQRGLRAEQYEGERWASVLTHPAGSVVVPVSDVQTVEPFDFRNPYAAENFGDNAKAPALAGSAVYVLTTESKYGTDVSVYATWQKARSAKADFYRELWNEADGEVPEDDEAMIDAWEAKGNEATAYINGAEVQ